MVIMVIMKRALFNVLLVMLAVTTSGVAEAQQPLAGEPEHQPSFDPLYYLGVWEIEWAPPDIGLLPPGQYTGTETVTYINSRFLRVDVQLDGEDGNTVTGTGTIFYESGLGGQSLARYVVYDAGFSLLQFGPLGGDLGGYYSHHWEVPEFEYIEHTFAIKGRSYYVSPEAYRVNQEVSVDGDEFFNFGIMWLRKDTGQPTGH